MPDRVQDAHRRQVDTLHLVLRHDEGVALCSPQIPELLAVRKDPKELRRDFNDILRYAAPGLQAATTVKHDEYVRDEGAYLVRVADDEHRTERIQVANRILAALGVPEQREDALEAPVNATGAVLFIASVAGDTITWISEQLDPRGEAAAAAVAVADDGVWTSNFARALDAEGWQPLEHWGWTGSTTLGEVMRSQPLRSHSRRVLVGA